MKPYPDRPRLIAALSAVAITIALVAVTAASAHPSRTAAKSPFRVLLVVPKSGPLGFVGLMEARGMAAAQQIVNRQGGILGHKVLLDVRDGQGSGTVTVSQVQSALASGTKYNLISCGSFGSDSIPCAAIVAKVNALQIPLSAESALDDTSKYPNLFITSSGFQPGADGVVAKMKAAKITKFAILSGDDTTGRQGATALQTAASKYKLTVTSTVFVPDTAADATPQLQQAAASNPQAFAMSGFTPAIPATIKARTKLGLTSTPLYADWLVGSFNFGSFSTLEDRKNTLFEELPFFVTGTPQYKSATFQAFMKQYYAYDSKPALMLDAPYVAWNALMLARGAAKLAGTLDGNKMAKVLAKTSKSSAIPGYIGGKLLYGGKTRYIHGTPSDYIFVKAGVQDKGILVPDK
jgi:ABC-type branched-subunit amino acid transport system substrate-binding protein